MTPIVGTEAGKTWSIEVVAEEKPDGTTLVTCYGPISEIDSLLSAGDPLPGGAMAVYLVLQFAAKVFDAGSQNHPNKHRPWIN